MCRELAHISAALVHFFSLINVCLGLFHVPHTTHSVNKDGIQFKWIVRLGEGIKPCNSSSIVVIHKVIQILTS